MKRGVELERIFVFKRSDAEVDGVLRPEIREILSQQQQDGIRVHVAYLEDLSQTHPQIILSRDYLVVDGSLVIHAPIPHGMPVYEETLVTRTPAEVKKYAEPHANIRLRATPLA